jgi:hypothetical protein
LDAEASAALRDRLLGELNSIASGDDAAVWAHHCMGQKNRLTAVDAQRVEEAFQAKLAALTPLSLEASSQEEARAVAPRSANGPAPNAHVRKVIDKSTSALPEPRRIRDREHVKFVAQHACLICGRRPSDAHHLRFSQSRALARKVSDEFTVPLCRGHHREVHRFGDEGAWWKRTGVDPTLMARTLWLETHPLPITEPADVFHFSAADDFAA